MVRSRSKNPAITSAPIRLLLVLALLLTQAPLLPAMILGAATVDGGHRVECGSDANGMNLRLAHCRPAPPQGLKAGSPEEHSCLLRLFVRETPGESDHQFSFTAPTDAVQGSAGAFETIGAEEELPGLLLPPDSKPQFPPTLAPRYLNPWLAFSSTVPPALDRLSAVVMRA